MISKFLNFGVLFFPNEQKKHLNAIKCNNHYNRLLQNH